MEHVLNWQGPFINERANSPMQTRQRIRTGILQKNKYERPVDIKKLKKNMIMSLIIKEM